MQWTRASEDNLPKDIHVFHVQWKQDNGMIIPAAWTRKQLSEYIKAGKHEYFYLDESPESSMTDHEKHLLKTYAEMIEEKNEQIKNLIQKQSSSVWPGERFKEMVSAALSYETLDDYIKANPQEFSQPTAGGSNKRN